MTRYLPGLLILAIPIILAAAVVLGWWLRQTRDLRRAHFADDVTERWEG